jgi:hypothetical protein
MQALNSSFDNRKLPDYVADLGETIGMQGPLSPLPCPAMTLLGSSCSCSFTAGLLRYIPDGVLVFFPSYQVMGDCISAWQQVAAPPTPPRPRTRPCHNAALSCTMPADALLRA